MSDVEEICDSINVDTTHSTTIEKDDLIIYKADAVNSMLNRINKLPSDRLDCVRNKPVSGLENPDDEESDEMLKINGFQLFN